MWRQRGEKIILLDQIKLKKRNYESDCRIALLHSAIEKLKLSTTFIQVRNRYVLSWQNSRVWVLESDTGDSLILRPLTLIK